MKRPLLARLRAVAITNNGAAPTHLQCALGGAAIATGGLAGFACHAGDCRTCLAMLALSAGGIVFAAAVRP